MGNSSSNNNGCTGGEEEDFSDGAQILAQPEAFFVKSKLLLLNKACSLEIPPMMMMKTNHSSNGQANYRHSSVQSDMYGRDFEQCKAHFVVNTEHQQYPDQQLQQITHIHTPNLVAMRTLIGWDAETGTYRLCRIAQREENGEIFQVVWASTSENKDDGGIKESKGCKKNNNNSSNNHNKGWVHRSELKVPSPELSRQIQWRLLGTFPNREDSTIRVMFQTTQSPQQRAALGARPQSGFAPQRRLKAPPVAAAASAASPPAHVPSKDFKVFDVARASTDDDDNDNNVFCGSAGVSREGPPLQNEDPSLDTKRRAMECVVCLESKSCGLVVAVPCGHLCACRACLVELWRQGNGCPLCRSPIEHVVDPPQL